MNIHGKFIVLVVCTILAMFLFGCHESSVTLSPIAVNEGEKEVETMEQIPILPSIEDDTYEIETRFSRGGALNSWSTDSDKWKNTTFMTYAFLTSNPHSQADYNNRLLWGQLMRVTNSLGNVKFLNNWKDLVDTIIYYR